MNMNLNANKDKLNKDESEIDNIQITLQNRIIKLETELKKEIIKNENFMKIIDQSINQNNTTSTNLFIFNTVSFLLILLFSIPVFKQL